MCFSCRTAGFTLDNPDPKAAEMSAEGPRQHIETVLSQLRAVQVRLQEKLDADENAIGLDDLGVILANHAGVIAKVTPAWQGLQKSARLTASQMGRKQIRAWLAGWFTRQNGPDQIETLGELAGKMKDEDRKEALQRMLRAFNDASKATA